MSDFSSNAGTVAELLSRGVWVAKIDARRNKTYYVNPHTGQSVWDLGKHVAREQASSAGQDSTAVAAPPDPHAVSNAERDKTILTAAVEAAEIRRAISFPEQESLSVAIDALLQRRRARLRRARELYNELVSRQRALEQRQACATTCSPEGATVDPARLTSPASATVAEVRAAVQQQRARDVLALQEQAARVEIETLCVRVYHGLHTWYLATNRALSRGCALRAASDVGDAAASTTPCDEQNVVTRLRRDEVHMRVLVCMARALLNGIDSHTHT